MPEPAIDWMAVAFDLREAVPVPRETWDRAVERCTQPSPPPEDRRVIIGTLVARCVNTLATMRESWYEDYVLQVYVAPHGRRDLIERAVEAHLAVHGLALGDKRVGPDGALYPSARVDFSEATRV